MGKMWPRAAKVSGWDLGRTRVGLRASGPELPVQSLHQGNVSLLSFRQMLPESELGSQGWGSGSEVGPFLLSKDVDEPSS